MTTTPHTPKKPYLEVKAGDERDGRIVSKVYASQSDFIVYGCEGQTWFRTEGTIDITKLGDHRRQVTRIQSLVRSWVPRKNWPGFSTSVAQIWASCLIQHENPPPTLVWDEVRTEVEQVAKDKASLCYLLSAFSISMFITCIALIILLFLTRQLPQLVAPATKASLCGMFGALASVVFRISTVKIEPIGSATASVLQGVIRPIIGCFFGAFAYFAIHANLVAGFARADAFATWTIIFVSGFSERLIPEAIRSIESATNKASSTDATEG